MANENQNRPVIENPELVEAIAEMRKDFKAETQNKVINLALKSSFLVPALINKNTQLVADADNHVKFEEKPQAKFLLITHKEKAPSSLYSQTLRSFQSSRPSRISRALQ